MATDAMLNNVATLLRRKMGAKVKAGDRFPNWTLDQRGAWNAWTARPADDMRRHRRGMQAFLARCEQKGECLEWKGSMTSSASGSLLPIFYRHKVRMPARRFMWLASYGDLLSGEWYYSPNCGNKFCVALAHIYPVTPGDRSYATHESRKRRIRADTDLIPKILEARRLRAQGLIYREVGARVGASARQVYLWCCGNHWTWVE